MEIDKKQKQRCVYCKKSLEHKIASAKYCNETCRYFWRRKHEVDYNKKVIKSSIKTRKRLLKIILNHYGCFCACCGEKELLFLTIDHVNNNGKDDRTKSGKTRVGGVQLYYRIINNNFPKDYQVLCMNCNWGKSRNNGKCPHKKNN